MAIKETHGHHRPKFVEEIDYDEIEKLEIVGKGSFGVVYRGRWRNNYVAVKHIDTEAERKAFTIEVRQLSRVNHPNIVKLYGACTSNPVCLVMEFAEGGSLYNVLHCKPEPQYNLGHAVSWTLQCAEGVAYLHSMKPKPLIHRYFIIFVFHIYTALNIKLYTFYIFIFFSDLKPPNLLLVNEGKTLKICDFGTACDKKTYMTNNKGSAAWMAPEVFEGSNYTEKCDVYSWGIILWQVLTRQKPFNEIGGSAYGIMWAVHKGTRPPMFEHCPHPFQKLITECWDQNPNVRPSMDHVVEVMRILIQFCSGHDQPLIYPNDCYTLSSEFEEDCISSEDSYPDIPDSYVESLRSHKGVNRILTNDSLKSNPNLSIPLNINVENKFDQCEDLKILTMPGFDKVGAYRTVDSTDREDEPNQDTNNFQDVSGTHPELDNLYLMLDQQLHPIPPDNTCPQSVQIFEEHKQLAQEYLKVQTEIAYLSRHMEQLAERLSQEEIMCDEGVEEDDEEIKKLENEKENLTQMHQNLKKQLELINRKNSNHSNEKESSS
ncbi:Protein kinase domain,Protein kinase-like domain,Protein kinase, ATP binding site,Serine- [Cinara cedri]|uniref:Protein kinase domain,Protein kinase-like domain,Protein kinase, ATP binding site,Serine n=1 Tax=Cinara cedri TaxID=506608 RepID=A0A5E4MHK5_9HEMI|nr:Protein kinase domain,Protein kinase-like domain,Protein kinase, ATP binding site,Serine- [Cinara cedri]